MNKQKKLVIERSIFVFIVFVVLGVIVVTEKAGGLLIPKVKDKMTNYIENNYKDIKATIKFNDITYKDHIYTMKVESKENKNHFFYITYSNKKMKDTYDEDFIKGKNLLKHIQKQLKKDIENKTKTKCDIEINSTLDKFTTLVKERLIKENNLLELSFYTIKKDLMIDNWNNKAITEKIVELLNTYKSNNISPKNYTITITNKNKITDSIEINNLTTNFINNNSKEEIINDIINNNNSNILKESKIEYKYLN